MSNIGVILVRDSLVSRVVLAGACIALLALFGYIAFSYNNKVKPLSPDSNVTSPKAESQGAELKAAPPALTSLSSAGQLRTASQEKGATGTFDTVEDVYAFVTRAASSGDKLTLVQGFNAAATCMAMRADRQMLEDAKSYAGADHKQQELKRVAILVLSRCRGFFDNDASANSELRDRITGRLRSMENTFVGGLHHQRITNSQFIAVMDTGDWMTFGGLMTDIMPSLSRSQGIAEGTEDHTLLGVAYILASCDIGKDCSSISLSYAAMCVRARACTGGLDSFGSDEFTQTQREKILKFRRQIADAWARRDRRYFGVGS
jgi:hypothetical protein